MKDKKEALLKDYLNYIEQIEQEINKEKIYKNEESKVFIRTMFDILIKQNNLEVDIKKFYSYLEKHNFDLNKIYLDIIVEEVKKTLFKVGFFNQIEEHVFIGLYPKNIFNGVSKKTNNGFLVLISDGLFNQLYKIIWIVLPLLEKFNLPNLEKEVGLTSEKVLTEVIHFLTDTFTNNEDFIRYSLSYSINNSDNILFNKVFEIILKFILYHEFGHIYFKHFGFQSMSQLKVNPSTAKFIELYSNNSSHLWETEADLFAIMCVLSEYENFSSFNAIDPNFENNNIRPDVAILSIYFYYHLLYIADVVAERLYGVKVEFDTHPQHEERIEFLKKSCMATNPNLFFVTEILIQINKRIYSYIIKSLDAV